MKKILVLLTIITLVMSVAFAAQTTKQLKISDDVPEKTDNSIRVAYSDSDITLARSLASDKEFGEATISGGTVIEANTNDTDSFNPEAEDEIYFAVCNAQDTNLKNGNTKIGDVTVSVATSGWILTENSTQVTSPSNDEKNAITFSAIGACTVSGNAVSGKITWKKGRQLAASSSFKFKGTWSDKELEAGSYTATFTFTYTTN